MGCQNSNSSADMPYDYYWKVNILLYSSNCCNFLVFLFMMHVTLEPKFLFFVGTVLYVCLYKYIN